MAMNEGMSRSHGFLLVCLVLLAHLATALETQTVPAVLPDAFRGNNLARHGRRADTSEKVFNVLDFGAVANGKKDSAIVSVFN